MAGTITCGTLSDGTNSTSSTNCIQGSAKAWVNFNGTSGAIRASYNVSSITVNGTGDHTVNFTTAMPDANYSICGTGGNGSSAGTVFLCPRPSDPTASAVRLYSITANDTLQSVAFMSVSIFR